MAFAHLAVDGNAAVLLAGSELLLSGVHQIAPTPPTPSKVPIMGLLAEWQLFRTRYRWHAKSHTGTPAVNFTVFNTVWGDVARLNEMEGGTEIGLDSPNALSNNYPVMSVALDTPEALRAFADFVQHGTVRPRNYSNG